MTLCKFRPQRTYDAQFIFELNDVRGLLRKTEDAARTAAEDGIAEAPYYIGASLALSTLFGRAEEDGEVNMWRDFLDAFDAAVQEIEGEA